MKNNIIKKAIFEQLQSNITYYNFNEDFDDRDFDQEDAETQAQNIAKKSNMNILRNQNLKVVLFDSLTKKIVGALWTSDNNYYFSFDIAIDKDYQGLKLSHILIKNAIKEYNILTDYGNYNIPMEVDVINPMLANILKTKYNFRVIKRISSDRVIMALKKNK
jgi:hypothetical protein